MRSDDRALALSIKRNILNYSNNVAPLPGVVAPGSLDTFVFQIIESIRRVRFVTVVASRPLSAMRLDPSSELFDPIRAAILYRRAGNLDEAAWLVFLFTHFGKNLKSGYQLLRDVYGCLGHNYKVWSWESTSNDVFGFKQWLSKNNSNLKAYNNIHRAFGNHRKYQSLDAWKANGTGSAIESYIKWVKNAGNHEALFNLALSQSRYDTKIAFRLLFQQMKAVDSFGRTAKFDYLTMIGKTGLADIKPDSVHLMGATGPLNGAKMLFFGRTNVDVSTKTVEQSADQLAEFIGIGSQEMEDSLCNWQKSPTHPRRFRG